MRDHTKGILMDMTFLIANQKLWRRFWVPCFDQYSMFDVERSMFDVQSVHYWSLDIQYSIFKV